MIFEIVLKIFEVLETAQGPNIAYLGRKFRDVQPKSSWSDRYNNINRGIIGNISKNDNTGALRYLIGNFTMILPFPASFEMHDQWIVLVSMIKKRKSSQSNDH